MTKTQPPYKSKAGTWLVNSTNSWYTAYWTLELAPVSSDHVQLEAMHWTDIVFIAAYLKRQYPPVQKIVAIYLSLLLHMTRSSSVVWCVRSRWNATSFGYTITHALMRASAQLVFVHKHGAKGCRILLHAAPCLKWWIIIGWSCVFVSFYPLI